MKQLTVQRLGAWLILASAGMTLGATGFPGSTAYGQEARDRLLPDAANTAGAPRRFMGDRLQPATDAPAMAPPAEAAAPTGPPPMIADVQIVGNHNVATERLLSKLTTHPGRPYLHEQVNDSVKRLFATNWFYDVQAEEKDGPNGKVIVYRVIERPTIQEVKFIGNQKFKDVKLQDETNLRPGKPMDIGYNSAMARKIESLYHEKGYAFATVEVLEGSKKGDARVVMKITEGPRTKINRISFEGNTFVSTARLNTKISSWARNLGWGGSFGFGGQYDPEKVTEDISALLEYYRTNGYLDARISRRLEWNEDKSGVYITFVIDEGQRYKVKDVLFEGNKIYDQQALSNKLKLTSGSTLDQGALKKDLQEVKDVYGSKGYINVVVNADLKFLDQPGEVNVVYQVKEVEPKRIGEVKVYGNEVTKDKVIRSILELTPGELADSVALRRSQQKLMETRLFRVEPADGIVPTVQFDPNSDSESEFQDVIVNVQEAQTGSIMFGVGVNSDSGVGGSFILDERNFDIARVPTSVSDIFSGHAFRGAGQEFRLEAVPGNLVNRYSVSFREPRLLGMDYSLSTTGYYFRRIYQSWHEERDGGRFTLGKRFTREIGGSITYRIENVKITDPVVPTPADLATAVGSNFLTSFRFELDHDTRDSALDPSSGHYIEAGYEQVFGDFDFPVLTLEARQHFLLHSRGDGSGKHILTARGELGWSGSKTPIFERFYAGGFRSLRGFDFRGVSPTDMGIEVGGEFMMLTGLEYQFPLTADDNLGWVFFVDAGTVERKVEILDYRVSLGFGLRVKIPQMGPAPLAFDFGFPVAKNANDDKQVFSFFLGFMR